MTVVSAAPPSARTAARRRGQRELSRRRGRCSREGTGLGRRQRPQPPHFAGRISSVGVQPGRQARAHRRRRTARRGSGTLRAGRSLHTLAGHAEKSRAPRSARTASSSLRPAVTARLRIWDVASGSSLLTLTSHTGIVWDAAFSPDGKLVVTADGPEAPLWDVASGRSVKTLKKRTNRCMYGAAFGPNSQLVVTATNSCFGLFTRDPGTARIWDARAAASWIPSTGHADQGRERRTSARTASPSSPPASTGRRGSGT